MREVWSSCRGFLSISAPPVLLLYRVWSPLLRPLQGPRRLVPCQPTCPDTSLQIGRRERQVKEEAKGRDLTVFSGRSWKWPHHTSTYISLTRSSLSIKGGWGMWPFMWWPGAPRKVGGRVTKQRRGETNHGLRYGEWFEPGPAPTEPANLLSPWAQWSKYPYQILVVRVTEIGGPTQTSVSQPHAPASLSTEASAGWWATSHQLSLTQLSGPRAPLALGRSSPGHSFREPNSDTSPALWALCLEFSPQTFPAQHPYLLETSLALSTFSHPSLYHI